MNPRLLLATVRRVLAQLRHDPRTVGLLVAVPSLLMVLLRYVFDSAAFFDNIAPALLGFFPVPDDVPDRFAPTAIPPISPRTSQPHEGG